MPLPPHCLRRPGPAASGAARPHTLVARDAVRPTARRVRQKSGKSPSRVREKSATTATLGA